MFSYNLAEVEVLWPHRLLQPPSLSESVLKSSFNTMNFYPVQIMVRVESLKYEETAQFHAFICTHKNTYTRPFLWTNICK